MDLFKSLASNVTSEKPAAAEGSAVEKQSSADLLASAKVVADAAQRAASEGMDKVDKDKAASAASDLLDAGSKYGHLAEKGYGQYVDKAQDYLHQFQTAKTDTTTTTAAAADTAAAAAGAPEAPSKPADAPAEHHDDEKKSDGGVGGLLKTAQGFF